MGLRSLRRRRPKEGVDGYDLGGGMGWTRERARGGSCIGGLVYWLLSAIYIEGGR